MSQSNKLKAKRILDRILKIEARLRHIKSGTQCYQGYHEESSQLRKKLLSMIN